MATSLQKADFSAIYDQPDPRDYFTALRPLDYQIPQQALPVLRAVLDAAGGPALDVCCSYGINGALLRCALDLEQLADHATGPDADDATFYRDRLRPDAPDVRGLDASAPAVRYALEQGLVTAGWAENLETDAASPALRDGLRDVAAITCTGGVGYIGAATFAAVLDAVDRPDRLWLAVFVLRAYDYQPIEDVLAGAGLLTEHLAGRTFRQRRFADEAEQQTALEAVVDRGLDPAGKEADGWLHADCFVTRPADAARSVVDALSAAA